MACPIDGDASAVSADVTDGGCVEDPSGGLSPAGELELEQPAIANPTTSKAGTRTLVLGVLGRDKFIGRPSLRRVSAESMCFEEALIACDSLDDSSLETWLRREPGTRVRSTNYFPKAATAVAVPSIQTTSQLGRESET